MLKITCLFRKLAFLTLMFIGSNSFAQVGIGTTSPNINSLLELNSTATTPGGLRLPRLALTNTTVATPLTAHLEGMFVYNTTNNAFVTPGIYYNDGSAWIRVVNSVANNSWALAGNTIAAANFLGTINALDLNIRTTNLERMRAQANGQTTVGFGAGAANADDQFSAVGTAANGIGVAGYSGGTGIGVYGQNIAGGDAVLGINNSTGNAVFGYSLGAGASGDAVHAEHDGSGNAVDAVNFGTGAAVYAENFFSTNYAIHAVDGIASVFADNTLLGFDSVIADTDDPLSNSLWARNFDALGTAVLGGSNNLFVFSPATGSGVAGSGSKNGIFGYAGAGTNIVANYGNAAGLFTLDTDSNPSTNAANTGTRASATIAGFNNLTPNGVLAAAPSYFGGYFSGGNVSTTAGNTPSYAYAGIKYNADANGRGGTNYKIIGNGTVSTIIKDQNNIPRIMFSPEAPEILFEDYGTGILINGVAQITIDPILKDAIYVDEKHPLKVFIQLEGDCNGVFVTNKSKNGFTVKELANGSSNVSFSWHLVANRADDVDTNGEIFSKHVGLRFPVGPGQLKDPELAFRKEGDNKVGKNLNSKKRPERTDSAIEKTDEPLAQEEIDAISKKLKGLKEKE